MQVGHGRKLGAGSSEAGSSEAGRGATAEGAGRRRFQPNTSAASAQRMIGRAATPRLLAPGAHIGPYTLLGALGSGGAGYVWTAVRGGSLGFVQRTALKVLRAERWANASAQRRFRREARVSAELRHPNIRAVYDLGNVGGCPYMSMRWVDTSLRDLLEHAPGHQLEPSIAAWVAIQCCAALDAAHSFVSVHGEPLPVLHRDLSPDNVLLTRAGHVLLSDFAGALFEQDPAHTPPLGSCAGSSSGGGTSQEAPPPSQRGFFGKLAYAAPESLREAGVDARADIFSLGCVLYEMLAGRGPFQANHDEADTDHALLLRVLENDPPPLAALAPAAPDALLEIVRACMQSEREARFQSAEALRRALCACLRRSGFELEEITGEMIGATLGQRLDQREAELSRALERAGPSGERTPGERTETLPLATTAPTQQNTAQQNTAQQNPVPPPALAAHAAATLSTKATLQTLDAEPSEEVEGRAHTAKHSTPTRGVVRRERRAALPKLGIGLLLAIFSLGGAALWRLVRHEAAPSPSPAAVSAPAVPVTESPVVVSPAAPSAPLGGPPLPSSGLQAPSSGLQAPGSGLRAPASGPSHSSAGAAPRSAASSAARARSQEKQPHAVEPAASGSRVGAIPSASASMPPSPKPAPVRGIDDSNPY